MITCPRFYLHGICSKNQMRLSAELFLSITMLIRVTVFTIILLLLMGLQTSDRRAQISKKVLDALASRKQPSGR
jgi:hypothetical protein